MSKRAKTIAYGLLTCCLLSYFNIPFAVGMDAPSPQSQNAEQAQSRMLQGQTAAFGILSDAIQSQLGFRCGTNQMEDVEITNVSPGTAAAASALKPGDHILDALAVNNAIDLSIERGGKMFTTRLRAIGQKPILTAQIPLMDNTKRKPFTLNAEQIGTVENQLIPEKASMAKSTPKIVDIDPKLFLAQAQKSAKIISDYKLELIVDRSESMQKPDCPDGLSRWAWCGQQAGQLSKSLTPYTPNGLTITPFATEYQVFEHATSQNIDTIFNGLHLQHGTRLFEPLTERIDYYFAHRKPNSKPLLIVVITDGVPFPKLEPALVKKTLIETSERMKSKNDVTVIFCQIGSQERFGQRYLTDLSQNLVSSGARYPFVHYISFDDLQSSGLGPALASQIQQYGPPRIERAAIESPSAKMNFDAKLKPKINSGGTDNTTSVKTKLPATHAVKFGV